MSTAKAIGGGLLKGLGQGMIRQDEVRREEAERLRQEALKRVSRQEDRDFQTERDEANREHRRGLLTTTKTGKDGKVYGITAGGETQDLGFEAQPRAGSGLKGGGGLSVEDQREINNAINAETRENSEGNKVVDYDAAAKRLERIGREDLAERVAPIEGGGGDSIDVNSNEYHEAARLADEWVDSQAGWFSRDSSDFEKYDGNREAARQAKTLEFYQQLTGQGGQSTPGASQPAATPGESAEGEYESADDVRAAYQAGRISRDEAVKVLREKFGYQ